jgi:MFS family permease
MSTTTGKGKAIFRVVSGNFLEMFDFMVYGFYATAIAKTFFPTDSAFASLMLSLATFGAGFLMRPLGAIFLGAYIDRHGRKKGLVITLAMMAACCKVSPPVSSWVACRCTWRKSPLQAAKASSSAGSPLASKPPWYSPACWV